MKTFPFKVSLRSDSWFGFGRRGQARPYPIRREPRAQPRRHPLSFDRLPARPWTRKRSHQERRSDQIRSGLDRLGCALRGLHPLPSRRGRSLDQCHRWRGRRRENPGWFRHRCGSQGFRRPFLPGRQRGGQVIRIDFPCVRILFGTAFPLSESPDQVEFQCASEDSPTHETQNRHLSPLGGLV